MPTTYLPDPNEGLGARISQLLLAMAEQRQREEQLRLEKERLKLSERATKTAEEESARKQVEFTEQRQPNAQAFAELMMGQIPQAPGMGAPPPSGMGGAGAGPRPPWGGSAPTGNPMQAPTPQMPQAQAQPNALDMLRQSPRARSALQGAANANVPTRQTNAAVQSVGAEAMAVRQKNEAQQLKEVERQKTISMVSAARAKNPDAYDPNSENQLRLAYALEDQGIELENAIKLADIRSPTVQTLVYTDKLRQELKDADAAGKSQEYGTEYLRGAFPKLFKNAPPLIRDADRTMQAILELEMRKSLDPESALTTKQGLDAFYSLYKSRLGSGLEYNPLTEAWVFNPKVDTEQAWSEAFESMQPYFVVMPELEGLIRAGRQKQINEERAFLAQNDIVYRRTKTQRLAEIWQSKPRRKQDFSPEDFTAEELKDAEQRATEALQARLAGDRGLGLPPLSPSARTRATRP